MATQRVGVLKGIRALSNHAVGGTDVVQGLSDTVTTNAQKFLAEEGKLWRREVITVIRMNEC